MTELPLEHWRDFYVLIGTASAAIVGASFVVATLVSNVSDRQLGMRGFITPTTVHLGNVLVGSAILAAPTLSPLFLAALLGGGGVAGMIYSIVVATRIWAMKLDLSDRVCHVIVPFLAYAGLAFAGFKALRGADECLNILAAAFVALLVAGMRNIWDMASFMIVRGEKEVKKAP